MRLKLLLPMRRFGAALLCTVGLSLVPSPASAGEINLLGLDGVKIFNNDLTPAVADGTFFGVVTFGDGQSLSQTFTIENTADIFEILVLDGTPPVSIGGEHPDDFSVTQVPATTLFGDDTTTFTVTFSPTASGIRNAVVTIPNTDSNEDPYTFAIQATVKHALVYDAGPGGTISGNASQSVWSDGTAVTVIPNPGYHFVSWSDGSTANPRRDTNVTQSLDVTALYLSYASTGTEISITDCDPAVTGALVVPAEFGGIPVTSIGNNAFANCSGLTSVTLPAGVASIGNEAFADCANLTTFTIPDAVTSIGDGAFARCSGLAHITIPGMVTSIGSRAFFGCLALESVVIPEGVTVIGHSAFSGCSALASVTIPSGVAAIEAETFCDCRSLVSVILPESVTSIGDAAFSNCRGLTELVIPDGVTSIGDAAFYHCNSLTRLTIPDSVTSIGTDLCYFCTSLTTVEIGEGLTSLSARAFGECAVLSDVTIGSNVEQIQDSAFIDCEGLSGIALPDGLRVISAWAFYNTSLTSISIPDMVVTIGSLAFASCNALGTATIGDGVTSIGNEAFLDCANMTDISLGSAVATIGVGAFEDCCSLASIVLPANVTTIEDRTFYNCERLADLTIAGGVTSIGVAAFFNCFALPSVTIPASVASIGSEAFRNCHNLTSINIPDGITRIENGVFRGCASLTAVAIPSTVTSIGNNAFSGCGLVSVFFGGDAPDLGAGVFDSISADATIFYTTSATGFSNPYGGQRAYGLSFTSTGTAVTITACDTSAAGELVIPATIGGVPVTSIGADAFSGCDRLSSIVIPESVTGIGAGAFRDCSSLAGITIPGGVTSIGEAAFFNCTSLTNVVLEGDAPSVGIHERTLFEGTPVTSLTVADPGAKGYVYGGTFAGLPVTGLDPNADPYGTGVTNLLTYAYFGSSRDPSTVRPHELPQWASDGNNLMFEFTKPAGVSNITYGAEWSRTMRDDWQEVADSDPDADGFHFAVPVDGGRKFLRLKVTEN